MALDIVCGKELDIAAINATVGNVPAGAPETDPAAGTKCFYQGKWYYFCSMACRAPLRFHTGRVHRGRKPACMN